MLVKEAKHKRIILYIQFIWKELKRQVYSNGSRPMVVWGGDENGEWVQIGTWHSGCVWKNVLKFDFGDSCTTL